MTTLIFDFYDLGVDGHLGSYLWAICSEADIRPL